jgi:hypothetical protein
MKISDECEDDLMASVWEERRRLNRAVFDWCIRNAQGCMAEDALESSFQWAQLAARLAIRFPFDQIASPALEEHLLGLARKLPAPTHNAACRGQRHEHWLHVSTETYPTGGHTAIIRKWIELDTSAHRHSVALLDQKTEVPLALSKLVHGTGGDVLRLDRNASLLSRAMQLRKASMEADVVVLHLFPDEVIPVVALGVSCGPPVLLMNIADHEFWSGGSVADVVLNLRRSGDDWIVRHRGISRISYLPTPLAIPDMTAGQCSELRASTRKALELPLEAPVILTSGEAYKYTPLADLNFFDAAKAILTSCTNAYLLALGPSEVGEWKGLRQATGGRVRAVGLQKDVLAYRACTDIYLEGFPFGSNAAFLEACLAGLPCVRAPRVCLPWVGSDGVAPGELDQPADISAYVKRAIELIADKDERRRCGKSLARAVRERHTGLGWVRYLRDVETQLPSHHSVYHLSAPEPVPEQVADFWTEFLIQRCGNEDPLNNAYRSALSLGLKPKMDDALMKVVRPSKHVRGGHAAHERVISLMGPILSMLPAKTSGPIYDKVVGHLCHDGRIMDACRRVGNEFSQRLRTGFRRPL